MNLEEKSGQGSEEEGRKRIAQVFDYLAEFNRRRNPVKRNISDYDFRLSLAELPEHPVILRGRIATDETDADDFILKVGRACTKLPPSLPELLSEWVNGPIDDPSSTPLIKATKTKDGIDEPFDAVPRRVEARKKWLTEWISWSHEEKIAREALKIFERLYGLYGQLEREAERNEIILGDGVLHWAEYSIYHPLLLSRLQLSFDPTKPEFVLRETGTPPELHTVLLGGVPIDGTQMARCRTELEQGNFSPLGGEDTNGFLRRVVNTLSAQGEFVADHNAATNNKNPQISRKPVIFLRSRTQGFTQALEAIQRVLPDRELSPWLYRIVGVDVPSSMTDGAETVRTLGEADIEEIALLSKPANKEQLDIIARLEQHGAVLVQGPPGTGKTHTIGNLIGHLLAQGKSVLVTSHTAKALNVVREKVVEPLRPLCVSVLGDAAGSNRQVEIPIPGFRGRSLPANLFLYRHKK